MMLGANFRQLDGPGRRLCLLPGGGQILLMTKSCNVAIATPQPLPVCCLNYEHRHIFIFILCSTLDHDFKSKPEVECL